MTNKETPKMPVETTPQTPQPPVEPLNQSSKRLPSSVWLPLVIIAACVVGYLALANSNNWWPYAVEQSQEGGIGNQRVGGPTANWQTYRNQTYGFDFKYPADWEVSELDRPQDSLAPIMSLRSPSFVSHEGMNGDFYVLRFNDDQNLSISQYYDLMSQGGNWYAAGYTPEDIEIDGFSAVRFENVKGTLVTIPRTEVTIKTPNRFYSIQIEGTESEKIDTFNQILSTFRFIE